MRVEDLAELVAAGDRAAASQLGRLLLNGDDRAIELVAHRLRTWPEEDARDDAEVDRFRADLLDLADRTTSRPAVTGDELKALHRQAQGIGPCETMQVEGVQARRYMLLGQLDVAKASMERCRRLERFCRGPRVGDVTACTVELYRGNGLLDLALGELETALAWTQRAVAGYEALGGPGHDVYGDGLATSLFARAAVFYDMDEFARAADDWNICVCRFKPALKIWSLSQHNLAAALARTGEEGKWRAYERLGPLRYSMRRGVTVERASFYWLDGQLRIALKRRRGLQRLRVSLGLFAKLSTPKPYVGVASDIVRSMYPNRERMKEFLDQIGPVATRLITDELHRRELAKLTDLVTQCPTEKTWPGLRHTIEHLRELAEGGGSLACLIPWRPCRLSGTS